MGRKIGLFGAKNAMFVLIWNRDFFTKIMEKWSIGNYEDGEKAKITRSLGWLLNMPRV